MVLLPAAGWASVDNHTVVAGKAEAEAEAEAEAAV